MDARCPRHSPRGCGSEKLPRSTHDGDPAQREMWSTNTLLYETCETVLNIAFDGIDSVYIWRAGGERKFSILAGKIKQLRRQIICRYYLGLTRTCCSDILPVTILSRALSLAMTLAKYVEGKNWPNIKRAMSTGVYSLLPPPR